jgi:hypothetical protein
MSGKVECVTLGLTTSEFLEIQISYLIACKNLDEKIATIHMCKVYDDVFSRESNQQGQKE